MTTVTIAPHLVVWTEAKGSRYGLSAEAMAELYWSSPQCGICGKNWDLRQRPGLDHDHRCECLNRGGRLCGRCVRGFLCYSCNSRVHTLETAAPSSRWPGREGLSLFIYLIKGYWWIDHRIPEHLMNTYIPAKHKGHPVELCSQIHPEYPGPADPTWATWIADGGPDRLEAAKQARYEAWLSAQPQRLTKTALKERGWTDWAIGRFLGDPDVIKANPHYINGESMKLYDLSRIEAAECSHAFQAWAETKRGKKPPGPKLRVVSRNPQ